MTLRREAIAPALVLFAILVAHTILETARDALFLARLGPDRLALVYLAMAACALAVFAALRRWAGLREPRALLIAFLGAAAAGTALFAVAIAGSRTVVFAFYVWTGLVATLVVPTFWTLLDRSLRVGEAKGAFAVIGAGGVIGAMVGSALAGLLGRVMPAEALVAVGAAAYIAALVAAIALAPRRTVNEPRKLARRADTLTHEARRYVVLLVVVVGIVSTIAITLGDLLFKRAIARHFAPAELATVFGAIYAGLNTLGLAIQLLVTQRLLERWGVGTALAILPAILALTGFATRPRAPRRRSWRSSSGTGVAPQPAPREQRAPLPAGAVGGARSLEARRGCGGAAWRRGARRDDRVRDRARRRRPARPRRDRRCRGDGVVARRADRPSRVPRPVPRHAARRRDRARRARAAAGRRHRGAARRVARQPRRGRGGRGTRFCSPAAPACPRWCCITRARRSCTERCRCSSATRATTWTAPWATSSIIPTPASGPRRSRRRAARRPTGRDRSRRSPIRIPARARRRSSGWPAIRRTARRRSAGSRRCSPVRRRIGSRSRRPSATRRICACATSSTHCWAPASHWSCARPCACSRAIRRRPILDRLLELLAVPYARRDIRRMFLATGRRGLDRLIAALDDPRTPLVVRQHLPRTIGRFGSRGAAAALVARLPREPDGTTAHKMLRALGRMRAADPGLRIHEATIRAYTSHAVAEAARYATLADALATVPHVETTASLLIGELLRDEYRAWMEHAFRALGILRPRAGCAASHDALADQDDARRSAACEILEARAPGAVRAPLLALVESHSADERRARLGTLAAGPFDSYEALIEALIADPSESVRCIAAYHVAEAHLVGVRPALVRLRAESSPPFVHDAFDQAIARLDAGG